jgi:hypothetical protein
VKRIVKNRQKKLASMKPPEPLSNGTAAASDIFGYGDHAYFAPLVESFWMPGPVGRTFFSQIVNRLSKDIRKIIDNERIRIVERGRKTMAFEFISTSSANAAELQGQAAFEKRAMGADPLTDDGEALTNYFNLTSYDGHELAIADMTGVTKSEISDQNDMEQVANMTLELALIMSVSRLCNDLLAEQKNGSKPARVVSKETRQKMRESGLRIVAARMKQIEVATEKGMTSAEIALMPYPSFKGKGFADGHKRTPAFGKPGYIQRPPGRPKGTTGTGKHQIAARLAAEKLAAEKTDGL